MIIFRPEYRDHRTGETRTSSFYYLRHAGRRWPLKVTDRRVAEEKARALIAQLELGHDPKQIEAAKREGLPGLVAEYIDSLVPRTGKAHRDEAEKRLLKLVAEIKAVTLPQFTAAAVERWLRGCGLAARTRHHYVTHCKAFGRWLVKSGKANRSPFEGLEPPRNVEADRRKVRRSLTPEEFAKLLAHLPASRYRRLHLKGWDRAVLYQLAAFTGLRKQELASLRPSSFVLAEGEGGVSYVTVAAGLTKNKKTANQPLPSSFVPALRDFLAGKREDRPLFPIAKVKTGRALRLDLKEAGVPVGVDDRSVDFHCLRVQYGTSLALKGVPLALAVTLMRHSTPALTAKVYTVAQLSDLSKEVEKLG
jgi:integrase